MVPNLSVQFLQSKDVLKTFLTIFEKLILLGNNKQKCIMEKNWDELYHISEEQQKVNQSFDETLNKINKESSKSSIDEKDLLSIKKQLNQKIMEYKELENINIKLLKDCLFISKQKAEKFFKSKNGKETYTKELNKVTNLWNDDPVVLNKLA